MSHQHVALVGTTAAGKSSIAMALAEHNPQFEIVSVDSMQVYRGMDIGTAKPTAEEQAAVPHHLIDLVEASEDFNVAQFQRAFRAAIDGIERRGNRALLVGGTGLYHRAVIDNLELPGEFPELRAELEADPDTDELFRRLASLDPVASSRMDPNNRRRLIRALEVTLGSGRPFSSFGPGLEAHPPTRFLLLGIWLPPEVIVQRIEQRYQHQLDIGFVSEVESVLGAPGGFSRTAVQALGYRELVDHLQGRCDLPQAISAAIVRTRQFARRQRKWFERDPRITWLGAKSDPLKLVGDLHVLTAD